MSIDKCKPRTPRSPKKYTVKTIDPRAHAFNVGIATDYCPNMALWLGHLSFWTEKNLANNKHVNDGLAWCYDTLDAICDYFPYFTRRQIETIINNSVDEGLVQRGNYNHTSYDRTTWYALTPKAYFYFQHLLTTKYLNRLFDSISQICEMDFTEFVNGFPRSVITIPDTIPDTDPDKKSEGASPPTHTVFAFPSKKELQAKTSYDDSTTQEFFKTKFGDYSVTYDEIFQSCKEHYDSKNQWVTIKKWKLWLEREKLDNYAKNAGTKTKAPENEKDSEKEPSMVSERQMQLMQEYLHARKMADWGQDINVYMPNEELRNEAIELLHSLQQAKESQSCQISSPPKNARANSLKSVSSLVSRLPLSQQGS